MAMLAMMMPVMLAIAAFVINVVYMEMVRTELQITTDLATRAAGRTLAVTGDETAAIQAADTLFQANTYGNGHLTLDDTDIVFGVSTRYSEDERYQFAVGSPPNAIKIETNGSSDVPMLFPTMGVPIQMRPMKTAISTQLELDIAIVLDRSGSMAYSASEQSGSGQPPASANPDWEYGDAVPANSRWLDTVAAVESFLTIMEDSSHEEQVSLITYENSAKTDAKLTSDYTVISAEMKAHSDGFGGGGTNIGAGILEGGSTLSKKPHARPWANRILIVMSDGIHNGNVDPVQAANQVASEKVTVYTVTFSDEANQTQMQEIASAGAGEHFHAQDSAQLVQAFEDIARSLPTVITF